MLGSAGVQAAFRIIFAIIYNGFDRFQMFFIVASSFFVAIERGFKELPYFVRHYSIW